MPLCVNFEYLCATADKAGWLVGLTLTEKTKRRAPDLGHIRLKRNATAPAGIAIPVDGDLARASRAALELLIAQVKK